MEIIIFILIILNSIALAWIFIKRFETNIHVHKDTTFINNTLVGYQVSLRYKSGEYSTKNIFSFYISLKNKKEVEKQEEINRMIATYSHQSKLQSLSAMFSWLRTWDEVKRFEKDYSVVDRKIVQNLVSNFKPKQTI